MARLEEQIIARFPAGTTERAEALMPVIGAAPQFVAIGKVTKSMVLRLALMEGLAVLEKRYRTKRGKKSTR